MARLLRVVFWLICMPALLFVSGFLVYLAVLPAPVGMLPKDLSHIAVLTGDRGRLAYGFDILTHVPHVTMVITGVHPQTSLADLAGGRRLTQDQMKRLVLDHKAATTRQNIAFLKTWATTHGVQQVGVVTSYYHMPRVRLLAALFAPELHIVPLPVNVRTPPSFFMREYVKLLIAPALK